MKQLVASTILLLAFVCIASAWPWGNVGLNVDSPEEQLDVGGNLLVRSNVVVRGSRLQIGEIGGDYPDYIGIRSYNPARERYDQFGFIQEDTFCFGVEDGQYFGFGVDGRFGANATSPWYPDGEGPQWGHAAEGTNRASIHVRYNPPGFIFNVNGVIWTNTP